MKRKRNCHGRTRTCSHTVPATICHHHHHLLGRIPELVGAFGNYIVGRHCSRISITWQPCRIILCIRAVAARSSEPGVCAARRLFRGSTVCGDSRGRKHMGRTCAARPNFISTPRNANSSLAAGIEFSRACRCLGCMAINQAFGTILLDMRLSKGKSALIRAGRKIGISPGISLPTSRSTRDAKPFFSNHKVYGISYVPATKPFSPLSKSDTCPPMLHAYCKSWRLQKAIASDGSHR